MPRFFQIKASIEKPVIKGDEIMEQKLAEAESATYLAQRHMIALQVSDELNNSFSRIYLIQLVRRGC